MGFHDMTSIALRATAVSLLSIVASLAIGSVALPLMGGELDRLAIFMCVLCPLAISWPATFVVGLQKLRLARLNERLYEVHLDLAEAHAQLAIAHHELAERVRRDAMTGLLSRAAFYEALERFRGQHGGTLLLLDVDRFKLINDTHGHLAGDEALVRIGAVVAGAVRECDIAGRLGGEEFGVFLVGADIGEAAAMAERIRAGVENIDFRVDGVPLALTVSIGVAPARRSMSTTALVGEADARLYKAKRDGRNRVSVARERAAAA